jgi:hypothetical protein
VTARDGADDVYQAAFCGDEINTLPPDLRALVGKEQTKPCKHGTFTFEPKGD